MNLKNLVQWSKRNTLGLIGFLIILIFLVLILFRLIPIIKEYLSYIEVFLLVSSISLGIYKLKIESVGSNVDISQPETNKSLKSLKNVSTKLIGRKDELETIINDFKMGNRPRVVSIHGIKGQGKTVLIEEVARRALSDDLVNEVFWETAKTEKLVGPRIKKIRKTKVKWKSIKGKFEGFKELNPDKPILFILENVDSVDNPNELIIRLPDIIGENICLITSRERICHQLVRPVLLKGLKDDEGLNFMNLQAEILHNNTITKFKKERLFEISRELGGNPLALKLLIVLSNFLPLESAYERIIQGNLDLEFNGGSIYTYLYKDIWQKLTPEARNILFYLAKTPNKCELDNIQHNFEKYPPNKVEDALASLLKNCLIDLDNQDGCPNYSMDNLTKNFLKTELPGYWKNQIKAFFTKFK